MKHYRDTSSRRALSGAAMIVVGSVFVVPAHSYEPTQSTGTGTHQGEDASMNTKRGGNTGSGTGRNEHSGSATGAVRDPKQSEPEADKNKGSQQLGSQSSHEGKTGENEGRGQAGVRTDK
ncbi:MAG: hypothetical protein K0S45_1935 [Nitrospira sp.]|nr:hypothetical protein [Nitrospira sp.]